jgi:hypothetical protein
MNFNKIAPAHTFIGQYMEAMSDVETSSSYDFWSAVWALGTCCGRGVYVPRPHAPVYMNWYIMLVAESGVTRKSTAVRMARDIVSHYLSVDNLIEGKATPEYLFQHLTRHPHTAISVSELVTFLGRESYVIDLPALLTDLYDCPKEKRGGSISRGEQVIRDAFVTFISASTPSWLRTSVNPTVVEGGFTSRCLFVHDERPKQKIAWPSERMTNVTALQDSMARTVEAAREVGHIEMLPSGMKRFQTWYKQRDTSSVIPFVASFNSREDAHVLRMAATLAINDGTLAIERKHIDNGIKLINMVKAGAVNVFQDTGNAIKIAQGIQKTVQMLIEAGPAGIPHTRLYAAIRHYTHRDEFHIVMQSMHEMGMVVKMIENRQGGGRRGVRYAKANGLTNNKLMQELMQTFVA